MVLTTNETTNENMNKENTNKLPQQQYQKTTNDTTKVPGRRHADEPLQPQRAPLRVRDVVLYIILYYIYIYTHIYT